MDNRMSHSIENQLKRKGKTYRERYGCNISNIIYLLLHVYFSCAVRNPAESADGQTFVPALFPPLPETQEEEETYNWLSEDDPVGDFHQFSCARYWRLSRFILDFCKVPYSRWEISLKPCCRMDKYVVFSQPLLNSRFLNRVAEPYWHISQQCWLIWMLRFLTSSRE